MRLCKFKVAIRKKARGIEFERGYMITDIMGLYYEVHKSYSKIEENLFLTWKALVNETLASGVS